MLVQLLFKVFIKDDFSFSGPNFSSKTLFCLHFQTSSIYKQTSQHFFAFIWSSRIESCSFRIRSWKSISISMILLGKSAYAWKIIKSTWSFSSAYGWFSNFVTCSFTSVKIFARHSAVTLFVAWNSSIFSNTPYSCTKYNRHARSFPLVPFPNWHFP